MEVDRRVAVARDELHLVANPKVPRRILDQEDSVLVTAELKDDVARVFQCQEAGVRREGLVGPVGDCAPLGWPTNHGRETESELPKARTNAG
jgi:hypothetical protein